MGDVRILRKCLMLIEWGVSMVKLLLIIGIEEVS